MASKSFHSAVSDKVIDFEVDGHRFKCRPRLPAGVVMRFGELMGGDDDDLSGSTGEVIGAMREFFHAAIVKDQYEEWEALLDDPDVAIEVTTLAEIAGWLSEQYTARPTGQPSSDTSPPTTSGPTSMDGHKRGRTTYSRPTPVEAST